MRAFNFARASALKLAIFALCPFDNPGRGEHYSRMTRYEFHESAIEIQGGQVQEFRKVRTSGSEKWEHVGAPLDLPLTESQIQHSSIGEFARAYDAQVEGADKQIVSLLRVRPRQVE